MKKILLLAFAGILFAASGYATTGGHTKVALIAEASRIPVERRKRSTDTLDYAIIHGTCKECHNEEVQHNRSVFP